MSVHRPSAHGAVPRAGAILVAMVVVVALLASACGGDDVGDAGGAADVATAAGVVPTAGGGQIDFGDLEGSPAMLWFWAPW
mgnify:CR=1 FL=1